MPTHMIRGIFDSQNRCWHSDNSYGRMQCAVSKNPYELFNLIALKFPLVNKMDIFQYAGKMFCEEF